MGGPAIEVAGGCFQPSKAGHQWVMVIGALPGRGPAASEGRQCTEYSGLVCGVSDATVSVQGVGMMGFEHGCRVVSPRLWKIDSE